jgi:hypothetical protein
MAALPEIDLASPLQFVINAASGSIDAEAKREVIEAALRAVGRCGDFLFCRPAELTGVAQQAATQAIANRTLINNFYDAKMWIDVETYNAGAVYTFDGVSA